MKKAGTEAADSSWTPWMDYQPLAAWVSSLWDAKKLSHEQFFALSTAFRTGHSKRQRDTTDVQRAEHQEAVSEHVSAELKRLREGASLAEFKTFPVVEDFLKSFDEKLWRRAVLVIVGGSNLGKSLLAADVLERLAGRLGVASYLEITVEGDDSFDLSAFDVRRHAGVLLDGCGRHPCTEEKQRVVAGPP